MCRQRYAKGVGLSAELRPLPSTSGAPSRACAARNRRSVVRRCHQMASVVRAFLVRARRRGLRDRGHFKVAARCVVLSVTREGTDSRARPGQRVTARAPASVAAAWSRSLGRRRRAGACRSVAQFLGSRALLGEKFHSGACSASFDQRGSRVDGLGEGMTRYASSPARRTRSSVPKPRQALGTRLHPVRSIVSS